MKKNVLLISTMLLFSLHAFSQAPNWVFEKSIAGREMDHGNSITADSSNNAIVVGNYGSDSLYLGLDTLINAGLQDIVITKYDENGIVIWAKSIGGNDNDFGNGIATDMNGNVVVTGRSLSDTLILELDTIINQYYQNLLLIKYDSFGNLLWVRNPKGAEGMSVSTDINGDIWVSGAYYDSTLIIGNDTLHNTYPGVSDVFIAKYDSSGNALWAKCAGGGTSDPDYSTAVTGAENGSVVITGTYRSPTITFNTITLTNSLLGQTDLFVAKYDVVGNLMWVKSAGGNYQDNGFGITTDFSGHIILTGIFTSNSIAFDTITLVNGAIGQAQLFVVEYDSSGNVIWAKIPTGTNGNVGNVIKTDNTGNIYVGGAFKNSNLSMGGFSMTNQGFYDVLVFKLDPLGNVLWARSAGGNWYDVCRGIAIDRNENVWITGDFESDSIKFGSTNLINAEPMGVFNTLSDIFVAKLGNITGIETNLLPPNTVTLYPNPARGIVNLNYPFSKYVQRLEVKDLSGRKIFQSILAAHSTSCQITVSNLSDGVYFVKITDSNGFSEVKKLIVE